jgi:hypothetical protein
MEYRIAASPDARPRSALGAGLSQVRNLWCRIIDNEGIWAFAVAAALLLQASLVVIHEPWVDEWQALQIALLSPDFTSLLENLRYEGHPPLWYLILRFTALFAHPLSVLMIVQLAIALSTQALVLLLMPLPRMQRLCIALGYFLLIEYGTISRSHSLGVLILIAFFVFQNRTFRWSLVALMPMVDFQFGLLSIIAISLLWRDGDRSPVGMTYWLISALLATWAIIPAPDMIQAQQPHEGLMGVLPTLSLLSSQLIPLHVFPGKIDWGLPWPGALGVVMGILFIWMADTILRYDRFHRVVFHGFMWACFIFSTFIYPFGVRHFTLVPLLLILLVSVRRQNEAIPHPIFKVWIATVAAAGLFGAAISFIMPFDVSDKAAAIIKEQRLEKEIWVAWPDFTGSGLVSRLQTEVGSVKKDCTQAFNRWDIDHRFNSAKPMAEAFNHFADQYGSFYVSSAMDLDVVGKYIPMRRVAFIPAGYNHYELHLYHVAYNRPPTGMTPPSCGPKRLPVSAWADPAFRQGWMR